MRYFMELRSSNLAEISLTNRFWSLSGLFFQPNEHERRNSATNELKYEIKTARMQALENPKVSSRRGKLMHANDRKEFLMERIEPYYRKPPPVVKKKKSSTLFSSLWKCLKPDIPHFLDVFCVNSSKIVRALVQTDWNLGILMLWWGLVRRFWEIWFHFWGTLVKYFWGLVPLLFGEVCWEVWFGNIGEELLWDSVLFFWGTLTIHFWELHDFWLRRWKFLQTA